MRALLGYPIESGKLGSAALEGRVFQTERNKTKGCEKGGGGQQSIPGPEGTVWLEPREEAGRPRGGHSLNPSSNGELCPQGATWDRWAMVGHLGGHMQV